MAGGWLMLPILICSIVALAIVLERLWSLRESQVLPPDLLSNTRHLMVSDRLTEDYLRALQYSSPLGYIIAAALLKRHKPQDELKSMLEDAGRHIAHQLNQHLNALATVAAVTPLLGLLGTVVGMISVFTTITLVGVGNPGELAGGISQALITTAAGLSVAIPTLMMHRFLRSKVDSLILALEQQASELLDIVMIDARRKFNHSATDSI